jgi:hypothetical protein
VSRAGVSIEEFGRLFADLLPDLRAKWPNCPPTAGPDEHPQFGTLRFKLFLTLFRVRRYQPYESMEVTFGWSASAIGLWCDTVLSIMDEKYQSFRAFPGNFIAMFALTPQANRIETAIEISRAEVRACTTRSKKGYNFDQMATILSRFAIARLVPVDGIRYPHGTGYVHTKGNYKTAAKFLVTMGEKKTVLELARAVNCQNSTYTGECYTLMEALYPCYETHQCKPNQIKWLSGHNYGMIASNTPSADTDQYWLPLFLLFTSCL